MINKEGNLYFASPAAHNLNPADYPGLNIVTLVSPAEWKGLDWHEPFAVPCRAKAAGLRKEKQH